jgi:hypothetical protein
MIGAFLVARHPDAGFPSFAGAMVGVVVIAIKRADEARPALRYSFRSPDKCLAVRPADRRLVLGFYG